MRVSILFQLKNKCYIVYFTRFILGILNWEKGFAVDMTKPNVDLLRRRTITDPDQSPSGVGELGSDPEAQDFTFAFNDINFSDRILRIEIVPDSPEAKPDGVGCSTASDWERNKKRRRADIKRDSGNFLFF